MRDARINGEFVDMCPRCNLRYTTEQLCGPCAVEKKDDFLQYVDEHPGKSTADLEKKGFNPLDPYISYYLFQYSDGWYLTDAGVRRMNARQVTR